MYLLDPFQRQECSNFYTGKTKLEQGGYKKRYKKYLYKDGIGNNKFSYQKIL